MMFQVTAQFYSNKNDDVNTIVYRNMLLHALLYDEEEHVALSVCLADMR